MNNAETAMMEGFMGKKVLLLVPHADDEVNSAGSLLIQFARYGVKCKVVYSTRGDKYTSEGRRRHEIFKSLARVKIYKDDIYFLRFDDFEEEDIAKHGKQLFGDKEGLDKIIRIIKDYRPDIIITNDRDDHPNHVELSELTDRAVSSVVSEDKDYRLFYLKTYAYSLAYKAAPDYRPCNLGASVRPDEINNPDFVWEDRLRFPVPASARTKVLELSDIFKMLGEHHTQGACLHACMVANSDKVFWPVGTDDSEDEEPDLWFVKICADDNYVYDYYTGDDSPVLTLAAFDKKGRPYSLRDDEVTWYIDGKEAVSGLKISVPMQKANKHMVRVCVSCNDGNEKCDEVNLIRRPDIEKYEKKYLTMGRILNCLYFMYDWTVNEFYRALSFVGFDFKIR